MLNVSLPECERLAARRAGRMPSTPPAASSTPAARAAPPELPTPARDPQERAGRMQAFVDRFRPRRAATPAQAAADAAERRRADISPPQLVATSNPAVVPAGAKADPAVGPPAGDPDRRLAALSWPADPDNGYLAPLDLDGGQAGAQADGDNVYDDVEVIIYAYI